MQPSSLVFLVLIAIWAAYLLRHWVRRREHLATARSVDRFSEAMRVLERRRPPPELDLSAPRPRSYAVSPARPSHPEVAVKPAQSPRPDAPTSPTDTNEGTSVVRLTRLFHLLAGMSARRVRGLSLLASLSLLLLTSLLAALGALPWWSAMFVFATLVADVIWLRQVALSEREDGQSPEQEDESGTDYLGQAARDSYYFRDEAGDETELLPAPQSEERLTRASESEGQWPVVPESDAGARFQAPMPRSVEITKVIELPAEADLSSWAPVPVPPPTYTLKAKAADPVPVPVVFTELAEAECWSLDGMVFDCELDELVERRSATGA